MLPVVLYECDTWSFTLREDHSLGVFESAVLRKIFGPKRDEVTGDWKRSHNDEILICIPQQIEYIPADQFKKNEMDEAYGTYGDRRGAYSFLVGKPEGKKALGRYGCTREDNIKMDV